MRAGSITPNGWPSTWASSATASVSPRAMPTSTCGWYLCMIAPASSGRAKSVFHAPDRGIDKLPDQIRIGGNRGFLGNNPVSVIVQAGIGVGETHQLGRSSLRPQQGFADDELADAGGPVGGQQGRKRFAARYHPFDLARIDAGSLRVGGKRSGIDPPAGLAIERSSRSFGNLMPESSRQKIACGGLA